MITTTETTADPRPIRRKRQSLARTSKFPESKPIKNATPIWRLLLLTGVAVGIHGYHLGADDAAIYLPAVKKAINPALYPSGSEFFLAQDRLSQFAEVVGVTARITHLNGNLVIFLWHLATIFLFLLAAWRLSEICFHSAHARWSALVVVVTVLTVPVAGTALTMMDPYLTARSASTPLVMLAVAGFLSGKRRLAALWIVLAAAVHPMMAVYGLMFLTILSRTRNGRQPMAQIVPFRANSAAGFLLLPGGFQFGEVSPAYRQTLDFRPFLFASRWHWFEWIGLLVPLALLLLSSRFRPREASFNYVRLARAAVIFGLLATFAGLVLSSDPRLYSFVRLQPLRAFHLIYILFFLFLGGVLGEYLLKSRYWLWFGLFSAIAVGMFLVQRSEYPASAHVELPWARTYNPWVAAFLWARDNTPSNAVFALDPNYIEIPGEDRHGFRAIAERSALSDYVKDSGVVSLFPQLAQQWQEEQTAQSGWRNFQPADFERLARQYSVSWVVLSGNATGGLDCPYKNQAVTVCRIANAE